MLLPQDNNKFSRDDYEKYEEAVLYRTLLSVNFRCTVPSTEGIASQMNELSEILTELKFMKYDTLDIELCEETQMLVCKIGFAQARKAIETISYICVCTKLQNVSLSNLSEFFDVEESEDEGYVYVMEAKGIKRFKIGKSVNPAIRHSQLSRGQSCAPLKIFATFPCRHMTLLEKLFHFLFAEYRVYGEWFMFDENFSLLSNLSSGWIEI